MKLRTKILSGFGAVLALTGVLGFVSWSLTNKMSDYSAEAALIDNARPVLLEAKVAYISYTMDSEQRYADEALSKIEAAKALFEQARNMDTSESNKAGLLAAAEAADKLRKSAENMVKRQQEASALKTRAGEILERTAESCADMQMRLERLVRAEKMDMDIDTLVNLYTVRIKIDTGVRTGVAEFSMTSAPEEKEAVLQAMNDSLAAMAKLGERLRIEENRVAFAELSRRYEEYVKAASQYLEVQASVGSMQRAVSVEVSDLIAQASALSAIGVQAVQDAGSSADMAALGVTALALVFGIAVALFISTNVNRQLGVDPGDLAVLADRVAGGDFDIDDGSPHIGVFDNLLKMVAILKKNIDAAKEQSEHAREESEKAMAAMKAANKASEEAQAQRNSILAAADRLEAVISAVSSASHQLSAQIEQSGRGAMEQAARMTETSTAMDEMNSTVLEVARNAGKAAEFSAETRQRAEAGADVVRSAVSSIQDVQQQSVQLKQDMGVLENHAQSIDNIMSVISDIADQTNLLALNAAIEAARAGDAGRGFAVVADEVRNLAEKTMASTSDVASAIRAIQESATKSVQQLDTAVQTISQATELATQSGDALSAIVTMAEETADQVRAIAAASEEQSASSEEITQSIDHVTTISGETAEAMKQSSEAVAELTRQMEELGNLVAEMKRG